MTLASTTRRIVALESAAVPRRGRDFPTYTSSAADMARLRLHGALDAALRDALPERHLCALADRIAAGPATDADRDLIAAFDSKDLKTAATTGPVLIAVAAEVWRPVARTMAPLIGHDPEVIRHATGLVRMAGAILKVRLAMLPTGEELHRIGEAIKAGAQTAADLVVIRALPGQWLRQTATATHFAAFTSYRLWDY